MPFKRKFKPFERGRIKRVRMGVGDRHLKEREKSKFKPFKRGRIMGVRMGVGDRHLKANSNHLKEGE